VTVKELGTVHCYQFGSQASPLKKLEDLRGAGDVDTVRTFGGTGIPQWSVEAEVMAMTFTNVYTFGPTFEQKTPTPPAFSGMDVEPEMAFCDLRGMDYEAFLKLQICVGDLKIWSFSTSS